MACASTDTRDRAALRETVEQSLRRAALWDEVKDKLHQSAYGAFRRPAAAPVHRAGAGRGSGSAAARRAMFALDPIATAKIEDLIFQLKDSCTIVIVTHNMQQAARVADYTGFFLLGHLIEFDSTHVIFKTRRRKKRKIT